MEKIEKLEEERTVHGDIVLCHRLTRAEHKVNEVIDVVNELIDAIYYPISSGFIDKSTVDRLSNKKG